MTDIIHDAASKRFKVSDDDPKCQGIAITEGWFQELTKHPYHLSKQHVTDLVEKPGTGIFLMKEHAKLKDKETANSAYSFQEASA